MASRKKSLDIVLNMNVRGLAQSSTVAINDHCNQLCEAGQTIYKLGLGQSPFPVPTSVVEQLQANAHQKDYLPTKGLFELREAVAEYHRRRQRINCNAEDVLIGPGSKELMFLLQLVYYGELVVPTPAWVSYAPQAQIIGRKVSFLHTKTENSWRVSPEDLRNLCVDDPNRPRIVILNYPGNPSGMSYSLDELKELAAVAKKYRVILLSDEIYSELHHKGQHVSIARFYPEGTIVSAGLSKWCGAGGWRLGTFMFPDSLRWLLDSMASVASETYTSTAAPIQYAAVHAFKGNLEIEEYLLYSRRILSALGRNIAKKLKTAEVSLERPQGGFYLFPDFGSLRSRLTKKGITTSNRFCELLLNKTGVAVLPGTVFGRDEKELTVRMAYVNFDGAKTLTAVSALPKDATITAEFLQTNCGGTMEAVDRILEWLK